MFPAGVEFTETVTLGNLLLAIVLAGGSVAVSLWGIKYREAAKAASFRADELDKSLDDERERRRDLEQRVQDEREKKHDALGKLAAAEKIRDLTPVIETLAKLLTAQAELAERVVTVSERVVAMQEEGEHRYGTAMKAMHDLFDAHEERAAERHASVSTFLEEQLAAMGEITQTLKAMHETREAGS